MPQRTVCLCEGKYIGIETIYTVIYGHQINIPEKLKELRVKSRNNELFCPCGCGSNLILVAGDKNKKEQHFRLKHGIWNQDCSVIIEGKTSIDSKIVLKCWLDDKLKANDIETRVQVQAVDDINRKYEFSFLSREKKIALSYCHERVNLSDEKLDILESNGHGIQIIYVVDAANGGSAGQYPEGLMKVQNRQGYCLLLDIADADYSRAKMAAVFYAKNIDGLWEEIVFAEGWLREFFIDDSGCLLFYNDKLNSLKDKAERSFLQQIEKETARRAEEDKRLADNRKQFLEEEERKRQERRRLQEQKEKERQREREEAQKRRTEFEEKRRIEHERSQEEKHQHEMEERRRIQESDFSQQETQIIDSEKNRWIKCEFCGKTAKTGEFSSYGGDKHINLGTCKECLANNPVVKQRQEERLAKIRTKENSKEDSYICPTCGGKLREKNGMYGSFMGCSNYPDCRYTRKIRH